MKSNQYIIEGKPINIEAIASNGGIVKVKIYKKKNKLYAVPVYRKNIIENGKDNATLLTGKAGKRKNIDESYEHVLEIFKYNYIEIETKDDKIIKGYYNNIDSSNGVLKIVNDNEETRVSIGKVIKLSLYEVDVLGYKHIVKTVYVK